MITSVQLLQAYNELLKPELFSDYCPNGLQVQGASTLSKLLFGVSANQALIDAAISHQVDAIVVHHGFFWKGENPCITGIKRTRLAALLQHDINLFAYHLPLDFNKKLGNNVELARLLNIKYQGAFSCGETPALGCYGTLESELSGDDFSVLIEQRLSRKPLHISANARPIKTVAWCTGAAQDYIEQAAIQGFDAFITGEVSERTVAIAKEYNIHFYAAGHHATEIGGIKALSSWTAKKFNVECLFVDISNMV